MCMNSFVHSTGQSTSANLMNEKGLIEVLYPCMFHEMEGEIENMPGHHAGMLPQVTGHK